MAGLKLKLRPDEQILINGAIIQNGKHQVELTVKTSGTKILRLRDSIHPDDANTPVKRVCYIAQMAVAGEVTEAQAYIEFVSGVTALQNVFTDEGSQQIMRDALSQAESYNFYKAMQSMRKLIAYEDVLLMKYQTTQTDISSSESTSHSAMTLKGLHDKLLGETQQQDDKPNQVYVKK
jgi:flagellar biosynthesis repressor protein FlbT